LLDSAIIHRDTNMTKVKKQPRQQVSKNPPLRQHQKDALDAIGKVIRKEGGRGKIILPTGTGKTRIEAETVCRLITDEPEVFVVLSPRILLAYQQLDNFLDIISRNGIAAEYMMVHSGGLNSAEYERKLLKLGFDFPEEIGSTTSTQDIFNSILSARRNNMPLVAFSTYHSVGRLADAISRAGAKAKAYIYDEAQYCVTSGDFQNTTEYDADFKFFFTATEKLTNASDGLGMNNENKFGKLLFTEKPKVLIERGEMASIAIHLVGAREQMEENDYESMAAVVVNAFEKHRTVLRAHSAAPDSIGPKMIVVCNKQDSLRGIMRSKVLKRFKFANQQTNLCALSSDFGIEINGELTPRANNKNKEILLSKMRKWSLEEEAIVLHVDMIAEGIDVPGVTAVLPFRGLEKIKFLQNVGRGTRLIDEDRTRLISGEIKPKDWANYVKPFCWLILPVLSNEYYDQKRRYTDWITALRADYGFTSNELVVIDNIVAPPQPTPLDDMLGGITRRFSTGDNLVTEIIHAIEEADALTDFMEHCFAFNTLTPSQQITMLKEIYGA
jgi:superfamily II DNA or RNA helicase